MTVRPAAPDEDSGPELGTADRPIVASSVEPTDADKERGPVDLSDDPKARLYTSAPLEAEDGTIYVIQQQTVGPDNELGGGEFPDPETPPRPEAAGAAVATDLSTVNLASRRSDAE